MKSHRFRKCSHLIFLYIIGYNNISWRPHNTPRAPIPKYVGRDPQPPGLTHICVDHAHDLALLVVSSGHNVC